MKKTVVFTTVAFIIYLLYNTGLHSDDFVMLVIGSDILPFGNFIKIPPFYYSHIIMYDLFEVDSIILLSLFKTFYILISIYCVYKFFSLYFDQLRSYLISLYFVFFITHDSTIFWFMAQYILISISLLLFSYYLIYNDKMKSGFFVATFGSFYSYGSTPIVISLAFLFFINKQYKKMFVIIVPNFIFIVYYFVTTKMLSTTNDKISSSLSIMSIVKQYILQLGTLFDAVIGPSMWLKVIYSISEITVISILIATIASVFFYRVYTPPTNKLYIKKLILILTVMVLLALGMFSITGLYPQIAFNLGNRVTIYGSLLLVVILVYLTMKNKKIATMVFSVFIFSILGLSDHWKNWNQTQLKIIDNISSNNELQQLDIKQPIFVVNHQYSKLGSLSHIEFFAEGIASRIFKIATHKNYNVYPLNHRLYYKEQKVLDKKYNIEIKVGSMVNIYDSQTNKLIQIKADNLNTYISSLPKDNRHWIQLIDKDNFIIRIIIKLMPRLQYAI